MSGVLQRVGLAALAVAAMGVSANAQTTEKAPRMLGYGTVMQGNLAADYTIRDYLTRGYLIGDQQFVAVYGGDNGGDLEGTGMVTFKAMNMNMILGFQKDAPSFTSGRGTGNAILGLAMPDILGAGISFQFDQASRFAKTAGNADYDTTTMYEPAGVNLFGSFNLGSVGGVYGNLGLRTGDRNSTSGDSGTTKSTNNNTIISFNAGYRFDATNEGDFAFGADLGLQSKGAKSTTKVGNTETVQINSSGLAISAKGLMGHIFKKNDNYSVVGGGALEVEFMSSEDKIDTIGPVNYSKNSSISIGIRPNFAFSKVLGKGFEATTGASILIFSFTPESEESNSGNKNNTTTIQTADGAASLGLTWTYENFSVEGQLNAALLQNGPNLISGSISPMFATVGVALGF